MFSHPAYTLLRPVHTRLHPVHTLFTIYAHPIHTLFTHCPFSLSCAFTLCPHTVFTSCFHTHPLSPNPDWPLCSWIYLGSHNLSGAAWGKVELVNGKMECATNE